MRLITHLATAVVIASAASTQTSSGLKLQTRYPVGGSESFVVTPAADPAQMPTRRITDGAFAVLVVGK